MCGPINLQSAPQYLEQSTKSAMSAGHKFILKKKLRPELVHMRSTTKASGHSARGSSKESSSIKEDCMIFGENYSTNREKLSVGRKRKSPEVGEHPDGVDTRMTLSRKRHCATVLIKLMNHSFGWVFSEPVDPVKLGIPDYFSIITKPMDLGTIKRKLEKQIYSTTCMFAADVRLTFSNAMRYNPPDNFAHGYAKELSKIFDSSWKVLESKWRKECLITSTSAGVMKNHSESSTKDVHKGMAIIIS
ncbi:transcription factor GTE9-like [Iris pallida]|uniref:Transcription factor GTE9-like n=1 Tax=Iris pallida TaxID=29817 RepID=A0AAX6E6G8_IRIPA|nr:transcription factor GTE9-like [Iris pallida]